MSSYYFDSGSRYPPTPGAADQSQPAAGQGYPGYPWSQPDAYPATGSYGSATPYPPHEAGTSLYGTGASYYDSGAAPYSSYGSSAYGSGASSFGASSGYGAGASSYGSGATSSGGSGFPYGQSRSDPGFPAYQSGGYGSSAYQGNYGGGPTPSGYGTQQSATGYPSPTYYPDTAAPNYPSTPSYPTLPDNYRSPGGTYDVQGYPASTGYPSALGTPAPTYGTGSGYGATPQSQYQVPPSISSNYPSIPGYASYGGTSESPSYSGSNPAVSQQPSVAQPYVPIIPPSSTPQPVSIPSPFTANRDDETATVLPRSDSPGDKAPTTETYPSLRREPLTTSPANQGATTEASATAQALATTRAGRRAPRRAEESPGREPEPHIVYPASGAGALATGQVSYASTPDPVTPQPAEPEPATPTEEIEQTPVSEYRSESQPASQTFGAIEPRLLNAAPPMAPEPIVPAPMAFGGPTVPVAPVSFFADTATAAAPSATMISPRVSTPEPTSRPAPSNVRVRNVSFFRVLRSEWLKFRTVGSTWWILAIALTLTLGFGEVMGWSVEQILTGKIPEVPPNLIPAMTSTEPAVGTLQLSQLVLTILGVLFITNEFSSGSIRATVTAAPTRSVVIVAKTVIMAFTTFVVSFVALFATEELTWYTFTNGLVDDIRTTPEGLKILAGAALANTLIVLFAFGVGVLLRNTAGSIGLVLGILLVIPIIMQVLPWDWAETIADYLPSACTTWLYTFPADAAQAAQNPFTFLQALGVSCGWAFVPLLIGLITFKVRDANSSGA